MSRFDYVQPVIIIELSGSLRLPGAAIATSCDSYQNVLSAKHVFPFRLDGLQVCSASAVCCLLTAWPPSRRNT